MFLNKFSFIKPLFSLLPHQPKYGFARFPTRGELKIIQERRYNKIYTNDNLAFPFENLDKNGGPQKLMDYVKKTPEMNYFPMNMAFLLYNVAKVNQSDPMVFEECERHFLKYKGNFEARYAFGCLYGFLKTNAGSQQGIEFLEEEVINTIDDITGKEAIELAIAASYNTQMSKEHLSNFITQHLKPKILESWDTKVKYIPKTLLELFDRLSAMEYFDKDIWEKILEELKTRKSIKKMTTCIQIHHRLLEMSKSKKFYKDLNSDIKFWEEKLTKRDDFNYRYNIGEQRWYSFQELKAKREDYRYTDQTDTPQLMHLEETEEDLKNLTEEERKALLEDKESSEREKQLDDIVRERLMMIKKGDIMGGIQDIGEEDEDASVAEDYLEEEGEEEEGELEDETKEAQEAAIKEKLRQEKIIRKKMAKDAKPTE